MGMVDIIVLGTSAMTGQESYKYKGWATCERHQRGLKCGTNIGNEVQRNLAGLMVRLPEASRDFSEKSDVLFQSVRIY